MIEKRNEDKEIRCAPYEKNETHSNLVDFFPCKAKMTFKLIVPV